LLDNDECAQQPNAGLPHAHVRRPKRLDFHQAKELDAALAKQGWSSKAPLYRPVFQSVERCRTVHNARASAIVISHRSHLDTAACLAALKATDADQFELIFVSNGAPEVDASSIQQHVDIYVRLNINTGAYLARNVGALFASAPILVFVEDDCIPYPDLLSAHVEAYEKFDCISVRGVYEPKTDNPLNMLAAHYDLGNRTFPQYVVAEGNASYRSHAFYAVGGWDDQIRFGGGGTDLALRLLKIVPDMRRQIYYPRARIRHDYAVDNRHLQRKRRLQEQSFIRLQAKHGEYRMARWIYRKYLPPDFADQTTSPQPSVPAHRRGYAVNHAPDKHTISLLVIDRARRPLNEWLGSIAKLRRRILDVVIVTEAQYLQSTLPSWLQFIPKASVGHHETLANAVRAARGRVVLFVDTETIFGIEAVCNHAALHERYELISVQGPLQRSDRTSLCGFASGPNLEFPRIAQFPINVSYAKDVLLAILEQMNSSANTTETPLLLHLLSVEPDLRKQIYSPRPRMIWNAPTSNSTIKSRPGRNQNRCLRDIVQLSDNLFGRSNLVPRNHCPREHRASRAIQHFIKEHDFHSAVLRLKEIVALYPEIAYTHFSLGFWRFLDPKKVFDDLNSGLLAKNDISLALERYKRDDLPWFSAMPEDDTCFDVILDLKCVYRELACLLSG